MSNRVTYKSNNSAATLRGGGNTHTATNPSSRFATRKKGKLNFEVLLLTAFVGLRITSSPTADLSYICIALYSILGRRQAIEALALSFVFTNLNPVIFAQASLESLWRYVVVFAAFASVFFRSYNKIEMSLGNTPLLLTGFIIYIISHSIFASQIMMISALKSIIWSLAIITAVIGWHSQSPPQRAMLETRFWFILSAVVVGSAAMMLLPGAYLPGTNFLMGLLGHSQALGALSTIVAIWACSTAMKNRKPSLLLLGVFMVSVYCVYASGTRTALVALGIALIVLPFLSLSGKQYQSRSLPGLKHGRSVGILAIGVLAIGLQFDTVVNALLEALAKYGNAGDSLNLTSAYMDSRGGLINEMWSNVTRDPILGIGFGIPSNTSDIVVTEVFGIPIGAPVEKGVTPLAVWEELGIVGLVLFSLWILVLISKVLNADITTFGVLLTLILINLGEASMLSAGGVGLFQIILLGWVSSSRRSRRDYERP